MEPVDSFELIARTHQDSGAAFLLLFKMCLKFQVHGRLLKRKKTYNGQRVPRVTITPFSVENVSDGKP
jgi:hypothetical protein